MHDFRKLRIWSDAVGVALAIYEASDALPERERYGLTAQFRSAAVSVSSNIAEGAGRGDARDMARFLRIALGSLAEVESQFEIVSRLKLLVVDPDLLFRIRHLRGGIRRLEHRLTGTED
jgi:four helix bundle protein